MDPRKQKRLGPAPIASFEKSFEDTTSASLTSSLCAAVSAAPTTAALCSANIKLGHTQCLQDVGKTFNENGDDAKEMMDINDSGSVYKTSADMETGIANMPNAVISASVSEADTKFNDFNSSSNLTTTTTTTTTTTSTTKTMKRAPLLKNTSTSQTNTFLNSRSSSAAGSCVGDVGGSFRGAATLCTPCTPRIELSRASSSSYQEEDSRDSSPENVFEQVGTGTLQETLDLGFREEGTLELRSSTEELFFMDPTHKKEEEAKIQKQQQQQQNKYASPHIFKVEDHQSYLQQHQRKDSASSEVAALLCISGRTSRISSVGSQGSAVSRLSAVSGISRSPSPHRMLLETSFCGPKPVESTVDGSGGDIMEVPTVAVLEQVLLSRTHDFTQAILAEGIRVETSPKKKPPTSLTNGETKQMSKIKTQNRSDKEAIHKSAMEDQRKSTKSPGQIIVGKMPSGKEYIRINLKPDFMYSDKGIASHEKLIDSIDTSQPSYGAQSQTKPASLTLTHKTRGENLLTPTASPKPVRKGQGSRSPSPATVSVSRKSSFSSLFRFGGGKDSPDSPRDRSRPRSKSKERGQTPQSQNPTPNKQKSVLAIFKPGKRGSSVGAEGSKTSKASSPTEVHEMQQLQQRSKSQTPIVTSTGSRPNSRLRYYDDPVEGYIHIPLHTPPEEKEAQKLLQSIQQLNSEPVRPQATAITMSDLESAVKKLKPVGARKNSSSETSTANSQRPQPFALKRLENLDAIHSLPQEDNKERTWSLEVNRHSSQDSQETVASGESYVSAIKVSTQRPQLAKLKEHVVSENGIEAEAEIHRLPSQESTTSVAEVRVVETKATINTSAIENDAITRERRRLMFATKVGSGSQEQIFATQFSISKTESVCSHMSEQTQDTLSESTTENLRRQNTVIKKTPPDLVEQTVLECSESVNKHPRPTAQIEEQVEFFRKSETKEPLKIEQTIEKRITVCKKSITTTDNENIETVQRNQAPVVMRRKPSGGSSVVVGDEEKCRYHSRSTSEDDNDMAADNHRHSRYLGNFDVRKKYHENVQGASRKSRKQSGGTPEINPPQNKSNFHDQLNEEQYQRKEIPQLPQPLPPSTEPSPLHTPSPSVVEGTSSPTSSHYKSEPHSHSQSPIDKARQTPPKPPRTSTPTRRSQVESLSNKPSTTVASATTAQHPIKKHHTHLDRSSVFSTDEPVESSESERDSDITALESKRRHLVLNVGCIEDHESTGLVSQDSFDDELPYIPTTLPEEKAQGVSLIPMKERINMEVKTCSLDRPRSTTPLNPSHLEEYIGGTVANTPESPFELTTGGPIRGEKLRISLPRKDSKKEVQVSKSPRRVSNASGKSWFEFAEEGLRATAHLERKDSNKQLLQQQNLHRTPPSAQTSKKNVHSINSQPMTTVPSTPPVTTPKASTQRKLSGHWIDFDNIPEKRKPPKKITTLPRDSVGTAQHSSHTRFSQDKPLITANCTKPSSTSLQKKHTHQHQPDVATSKMSAADGYMPHYNYVKPEDCQCECHESKVKDEHSPSTTETSTNAAAAITPDSININNKPQDVDILPKGEDMLPLLSQDSHEGAEPSDSSREYNCYTDDELNLSTRNSTRPKNSSSKLDEFPRRNATLSKKFPDN